LTFTGSRTRPWSPVSGIGTTGRRHFFRSTDIRGREFGDTTTASKDGDRGAPTIVMYNINVGSWLYTSAAAIGLRLGIGIGRVGYRRHRVAIWTGGMALGQEWFDKVVVSHIWSRRGGTVRSTLGPLESVLGVHIGAIIHRVSARVAPDFVVSTTGEEACDDYTDDCANHEGTNA
jgi:hypothetical protein